MIYFNESISVYVSLKPIDFRCGLNRLLSMVTAVFEQAPQAAYLFLFRDRTGKKIKALFWDKTGFVMLYKQLDAGRFQFPKIIDGHIQLNRLQLECLLSGMNFMPKSPQNNQIYTVFN